MHDFYKYLRVCVVAGVNFKNVDNIASHWLYGSSPWALARMSNVGIVYNPPGH